MKWISIISFVVGFALAGIGQNESVIGGLTATEFNGKVLLTWSVKQGNTCNGIQILRSIDSVNFVPIGSINGVCGSTQEDTPYEFTDVSPEKNTINYYRLNLGGIGYSKIVWAEVIDIAENNYLLRPNPVEGQSELHFKNDASNLMLISFYDQTGTLAGEIQTTNDQILLYGDEFDSGLYFFTIVDSTRNTSVKGKFIIP